jgi:hypothetical protein
MWNNDTIWMVFLFIILFTVFLLFRTVHNSKLSKNRKIFNITAIIFLFLIYTYWQLYHPPLSELEKTSLNEIKINQEKYDKSVYELWSNLFITENDIYNKDLIKQYYENIKKFQQLNTDYVNSSKEIVNKWNLIMDNKSTLFINWVEEININLKNIEDFYKLLLDTDSNDYMSNNEIAEKAKLYDTSIVNIRNVWINLQQKVF